jgi:hypothetical protein
MSAKELDRLKVLHEVKKRHITQKQAAAELGLRVCWVRKLLLRWRRWAAAWLAWPAVKPENVRSGETASGGAIPAEKPGQAMA